MPIYKCDCEDEWIVNAKNKREALKIVLEHEKKRLEKRTIEQWKYNWLVSDFKIITPEWIKTQIAEDQRLIREGFTATRVTILSKPTPYPNCLTCGTLIPPSGR